MAKKPSYEELRQKVKELEKGAEGRKISMKRNRQLNILREDLLKPANLSEKLKRITDEIVEIFDADFCRIWLVKPGDLCSSGCIHAEITEGPHVCEHRDCCLHLVVSSGRYTHIDGEMHRRVPFGCYKIGLIASEVEPKFITNDVTNDPRIHDHEWARELGLVSFSGYRVLSEVGKPRGVLALFCKHHISPEEDDQLEDLANSVAQLIQTAKAEEELRESGERYRILIETATQSGQAITMQQDRDGIEAVCGFSNEAAVTLTGYTRDELSKMSWLEIVHPVHRDAAAYRYRKRMQGEEISELFQIQIIRKDGIELPIELTSLLATFKGTKTLVTLSRDITERRQVEEALKKYSEQLEEAVEERTKALKAAQEELVRKEKLSTIGHLAGGVGHELRNPLGSIKNGIYFLNMALERSDPDVQEALNVLDGDVERCGKIVQDLFDYASPKLLSRMNTNINDLLKEELSRISVPQTVEIILEMDEALPLMVADQNRLGQVFGNLIRNGVQAMPDGGRLTIRSEATEPGQVAISFKDTGGGISDENLGKIFDPLFTTKAKGIGLGLALCKTSIEEHSGEIIVASEIEKGTTFTVKLPWNTAE